MPRPSGDKYDPKHDDKPPQPMADGRQHHDDLEIALRDRGEHYVERFTTEDGRDVVRTDKADYVSTVEDHSGHKQAPLNSVQKPSAG